MLRFLFQKLTHKKWMVLSLLIGNILLIAIAASHPMYKSSAVQRMFADDFQAYLEENNEHPAKIHVEETRQGVGETQMIDQLKAIINQVDERLGVPMEMSVLFRYQVTTKAVRIDKRNDTMKDCNFSISTMTDFLNHIEVVSGTTYSTELKDNVIEAMVSESVFVDQNLIIGDMFELPNLHNAEGEPLQLKIVGIFRNNSSQDAYWVKKPNSYKENIFIAEGVFSQIYDGNWNPETVLRCQWDLMLDKNQISPKKTEELVAETEVLLKELGATGAKVSEPVYLSILSEFESKENKVTVTLAILQIPILVLLCAFLFMISAQLLSMEQNEISMFKSRGASGFQIFFLYLLQSVLLCSISVAVGLPLGRYLCQVLGSANAFLEFVQRRPLTVVIDEEVWIYTIGAALLSILMTVLPVISYSKVSIVNLKQKKARNTKKLWQVVGLDFILLGVSIYGLYTFTLQKEELVTQVLNGKSLDPLLYFSSSLFILGAGLVALRLQPLLVKMIYFLGKKHWKPVGYASFLQTIRTSSKQYFIMAFLILTVALGMFNATVARTILANAENNTRYQSGADLVLQEHWDSNESTVKMFPGTELVYYEPLISKYDTIEGVQHMAKVYRDNGKVDRKYVTDIMGIDTKDFGEVAYMPQGLLPTHINNYLNALASNANAVLLSENFRRDFGYQLGDTVYITNSEGKATISVVIYGFFSYWPSYSETTIEVNADGTREEYDNYLVVGNLSTFQSQWDLRPYEIWFDLEGSSDAFYAFAEQTDTVFTKFEDMNERVKEIRNQTLFQGTNGILTMSFIVILILCGAGFLIYWILSIRSRELLFGVFRAMGMSRNHIFMMLINEQVFSSLLSIAVGAGIGALASKWFVPLIQIAYAADNQVLPLELITQSSDMVRLFAIIGLVFVVCMIVLARIIFNMKIAHALKLGED